MTLTGEGCLRKQTTRPPDILLRCASVQECRLSGLPDTSTDSGWQARSLEGGLIQFR